MKRIESFCIDHDSLKKGMYVSRIDRDIITYDIRMAVPNAGKYITPAAGHTFEHLFATFARNSKYEKSVIYVGPMGCRTGFYFLLRDDVSKEEALLLVKEAMEFIKTFEGEVPGTKTSAECGNYLEHDLEGARALAQDMAGVLERWTVRDMSYIGSPSSP